MLSERWEYKKKKNDFLIYFLWRIKTSQGSVRIFSTYRNCSFVLRLWKSIDKSHFCPVLIILRLLVQACITQAVLYCLYALCALLKRFFHFSEEQVSFQSGNSFLLSSEKLLSKYTRQSWQVSGPDHLKPLLKGQGLRLQLKKDNFFMHIP